VAWLLSLVVGAPMPSVAASGGQVVAAFAGHDWQVLVNLVLSEGVAAIALSVVVLMTARVARRAGARRAGLAAAVFGVTAAAVSLAELGMLLANALSDAVLVSAPLLLVVVTATGMTLRTSR
jgi:hypothetical protein